jgi:hypothetical protein
MNPIKQRIQQFRQHITHVAVTTVFAAVFVSLTLSAFHEPTPHNLPIGVVGEQAAPSKLATILDAHAPGGFDLRSYTSAATARHGIDDRIIDGAVVITAHRLQVFVAQALGIGPTGAITNTFQSFAAATGRPLQVIDVAPALPGDSDAFSPFFIMLVTLIASMVSGVNLGVMFRKSGRRWLIGAPLIVAIVLGLAIAGVTDGFTGYGHYFALASILALFSLAVSESTAALAMIRPFLVALASFMFVVLGIPASGGPAGLAPFAPSFIRVFDSVLPLGVGESAVRNLIYFQGHDTAAPLWTLAAWAITGLAAFVLLHSRRQGAARNAMAIQ